MDIQLIFTDYNCASSQFTCDNGKCVYGFGFCDGYNDCGDYSDEDGCKDTVFLQGSVISAEQM